MFCIPTITLHTQFYLLLNGLTSFYNGFVKYCNNSSTWRIKYSVRSVYGIDASRLVVLDLSEVFQYLSYRNCFPTQDIEF